MAFDPDKLRKHLEELAASGASYPERRNQISRDILQARTRNRLIAVAAVAVIGVVGAFLVFCRQDPPQRTEDQRIRAVLALEPLDTAASDHALRALQTALRDNSPTIRRLAVSYLSMRGMVLAPDLARDFLDWSAGSGDADLSATELALRSIERWRVPTLRAVLDAARIEAAKTGQLGYAASLVPYLTHDDALIRLAAVRALASLGDFTPTPAQREHALSDPDERVRQAASSWN